MKTKVRTLLLATTAMGLFLAAPAQAADGTADAIKALQAQVNALQKQLTEMQSKETERAKAEAAKPAAAAPAATAAATDKDKKEILPGVSVKLGGYIAMEGLYRDKNQGQDMSSNLNASIPYDGALNSHQDEFKGSARQTRLSLLAEGKPSNTLSLAAFVESDFMGTGSNSSSVQSNNYVPRLRNAYATMDHSDWGLQVLAGQSWSLASLFKTGITPRQEAGVMTIDSAGPPGYVWTRSPQVRVVKSLADKKINLGLSVESPSANTTGLGTPAVATYSSDFAPDVIAKAAFDTSYGHYEVFGMTRFFRDIVNANGHNNYAVGYGGGVGAFVPMFSKKLDLVAHLTMGRGMGRYASAQLPDFAYTETGDINPLTQMTAMVGFIGHPTPTWDIYAYAGGQRVLRDAQGGGGTTYGYGNWTANNSGCNTIGGTCQAQTKTVWQVTPGFWNTIYKGDYGNVKVGGQYSFTRKDAFSGTNSIAAHAYENMVFMSFRYAPF